jgi:ribonuclease P protein subunit POP4
MPNYNNKNIVMQELIGLEIEVVNSSDISQIGTSGTVIDETKNTLLVKTVHGTKRVIKKISTFKFVAGKDKFIVDGEEINFRPHERIEKGLKFYRKRA